MAENIVTPVIPPGAKSIVFTTNGASTLYTAVAGRRFHLVACAISIDGAQSAKGNADITITPENGALQTVLRCQANVGLAADISLGGFDVPTVSSVSATVTTLTGATIAFSIIGWEESTPS